MLILVVVLVALWRSEARKKRDLWKFKQDASRVVNNWLGELCCVGPDYVEKLKDVQFAFFLDNQGRGALLLSSPRPDGVLVINFGHHGVQVIYPGRQETEWLPSVRK